MQNYLSTAEFAESRAALGNWLSANKNLEASLFSDNPLNELSYEVLQDPEAVVPVRRLGPDAGVRRCGFVLEGDDRLDQRRGHQDRARPGRGLLAELLIVRP